MALGATALLSGGVRAAPTLVCGPTRQWVCVIPGCPHCPVFQFEGTVCEKAAYEKQTGRVCSPA
jgi:Ni,Fe-hydrogenase III small subunit